MRCFKSRLKLNGRLVRAILVPAAAAWLISCSGPGGARPYYSRSVGAYTTAAAASGIYGIAMDFRSAGGLIEKKAVSYLGVPYKWGGAGKSGMDCSGFVRRVYNDALQINLPHNASSMGAQGTSVSKNDLVRGDILLFGSIWGIDHTGIYLEKGKFIHASPQKGVMYSSMSESYFKKRYKAARRIIK